VQAAEASSLYRFGAFELDIRANELRRAGVLLKLAPQPLQLLRLLVENAGQVLTREQIQAEVWGDSTFVDFDRNLNVCVAQIRSTLKDDSDAPRYIQTIPKRGYRFIAPVERVNGPTPSAPASPRTRPRRLWLVAMSLMVPCLMFAGLMVWRYRVEPRRVLLAALPFENLTADPKQDLFTDGLTEELIAQFGSLNPGRLGVIGRTSVMRYKGGVHAIDQVGRDLRVDYVVEGSVRRGEGRFRITARLIKVADQAQVWTDTLERDESEMSRIEENVAASVTAAVAQRLLGGTATTNAAPRSHNEAAYNAYLNGRYLQRKERRADLERSLAYFEDAAKLDPQFDTAYSALAESYVSLGQSGSAAADTFPAARAAAEKALAIRDTNAEAHNALANALFWYDWKWAAAEQHFARALAINSSYSEAHHDYAFFLVAMGKTQQGLASLKRAIAMNPLSTRVNIDAGWILLQAHRFDEAIKQARRAQELEPGLAEANACIARSLFYQKKYREAADLLRVAGPTPEQALERVHRERVEAGKADAFTMATSYVFLGEKSKALDALERAYTERNIRMPLLLTEPSFDPLHAEPRFRDLAGRLALP
jgi:TolB-like protein/DNA-binding winged helix-turn-helix (wHTH) protein